MSTHDLIDNESTAVVIRERSAVVLTPVMDVNTAKAHMREFQEFIAEYLEESTDGGASGDYGTIQGTKKKTLLKSGADKLCEVYGLYDEYQFETKIEDWDKGIFAYTLVCTLKTRRDDSVVGNGVGSCSSYESKYRWRDAKRQCPKCGNATIIKGQEKFGGGWICWKKEGKSDGCGAKFADADKTITEQIQGRVENPDIADIQNTVLKMAKKRAKIDATISVTRSSGILTQDLEDLPPMPAKPQVPVTSEDIPLGSPAQSGTVGKWPVQTANNGGEHETQAAPAVEYITPEQASVLHIHFKDFLDKSLRKKADSYIESWCKSRGLVDAGGAGSTKFIKATYIRNGAEVSGFTEAKAALEQYALDLNVKMSESK